MDNVLTKALSKNPTDRFATCTEFAQALAAAAGGHRPFASAPTQQPPTQQAPVPPPPTSPVPPVAPADRTRSKNRWLVPAAHRRPRQGFRDCALETVGGESAVGPGIDHHSDSPTRWPAAVLVAARTGRTTPK